MKPHHPHHRRILLDSGYKGRQRPKLEMYDLRQKTDITAPENADQSSLAIAGVIGTAIACGWLGSDAISVLISLVGL